MTPDAIADVIVGTVKRAVSPVLAKLDATAASLDDLRGRLVAVESRSLESGPPGPPGPPGDRGADGADGLGFDDLSVEFDGDRTVSFVLSRGEVRKSFPVALPFMRYQGAFTDGVAYVVGDVVTAGGNAWHCQKPTTLKPGNDVSAWRLMVRKGRDGRDVLAKVG